MRTSEGGEDLAEGRRRAGLGARTAPGEDGCEDGRGSGARARETLRGAPRRLGVESSRRLEDRFDHGPLGDALGGAMHITRLWKVDAHFVESIHHLSPDL